MRYPTSGWDALLGEFEEFLTTSGVLHAEEQAAFFLSAIKDLENAIQTGLITNIIESGKRPMVVLTAEESLGLRPTVNKVGHA